MGSLSHPPHYLFPDYLLGGLPAPPMSSSSDGSSGSMHWATGEVNNYLPITDYSTTFNNNIDTMQLPLHQYSSPDISSTTTTTTEFFSASSGGVDYSSNFWPPPPSSYPITSAAENWDINEARIDGVGQYSTTLKVTRYSPEEKKHRIIRYLKKKSQRNFKKTIKYACRKTLADKRVRVRGRFAKNKNDVTSSDDDQYQTLAHNYHTVNIDQPCYNVCSSATDDLSFLQMKTAAPTNEEEWLQEAIATFMYYRILPDVASIS